MARRGAWALLAAAEAVAAVAAAAPGQHEDLSRYALTDVSVLSRSAETADRLEAPLTPGPAQTESVNGGNTFPGVSRPLGMVKLGPDLYTGADAYSGYQPGGNFTDFSMLHESGTGGAPKYGVVSQMPVANPLSGAVNDTRAAPDRSEVGYYRAVLGSGTTVELAASHRAGLYQYTFPRGRVPSHVVDVSHLLSSYRGQGLEQRYLSGNITVRRRRRRPPPRLEYSGFGTYDNVSPFFPRPSLRLPPRSHARPPKGWNRADQWTVFFCGRFDAPGTFRTFVGVDGLSDRLAEYAAEPGYESRSARLGAVLRLPPDARRLARRRLLRLRRRRLRQLRRRDPRGHLAALPPPPDARLLELGRLLQADDRHQRHQAHPAVLGPVLHASASHQEDGREPALVVPGALLRHIHLLGHREAAAPFTPPAPPPPP